MGYQIRLLQALLLPALLGGCMTDDRGKPPPGGPGGSGWTDITPAKTPGTFYSVHFTSPTTGFVAGDSGTLLKTTDGGASWKSQEFGTKDAVLDVDFVDANTGYIAGGGVRKTTDGGATWTAGNPSFVSALLVKVAYPDANHGFGTPSAAGFIAETNDGGMNWVGVDSGLTSGVVWLGVFFINPNVGFICGSSGNMMKTMDAGVHWTALSTGTTDYLYDVFFVDADRGYAAGVFNVYKTVDGGATWVNLKNNSDQPLSALYFLDANRGYAVGWGGLILYTEDGGTTWIRQSGGGKSKLHSVYFPDANTGYVVGGEPAVILKLKGSGSESFQASTMAFERFAQFRVGSAKWVR